MDHENWTLYAMLLEAYGTPNKWKIGEDGTFIPDFMTDEYFEALKMHRKIYQDGLMNKELRLIVNKEEICSIADNP